MMQELFKSDPQAKLRYENNRRYLDDKVRQYMSNPSARLMGTNAVINIPVVVHIMTSNPNLVTNAVVQSQIDTLNKYYSGGSSTDSLRVYAPFRTAYGRTQIRFCLAKRTPNNVATTGIERQTVTTTYSTGGAHPSSVVAAWDTRKYLNVWVVESSGTLLGYAYKPGTFAPGDQRIGFVVDYRAFGSGASYLYSSYSHGKTAVHEIGHYFNLDHPWGPNNDKNDATCSLDDGCSDTPKTSDPTYGCPSSPLYNSCSSSGAGVMWQNHMDYANDACMVLFTAQQASRMETALNSSSDRITLLSSNGCQALPPAAPAADLQVLSASSPKPFICVNNVAPYVTVKNAGPQTITEFKIAYTIDNGPEQTSQIDGLSLATNNEYSLFLASTTTTQGMHTIKIYTWDPVSSLGMGDYNTSNDTLTLSFSYLGTTAAPLTESFETSGFPPSGWGINNPDNSYTWSRTTNGHSSAGAVFINTFNYPAVGQKDDMAPPVVTYSGVDSVKLTFDLAASPFRYQFGSSPMDTLEVLASADCGNSYTSLYKKYGGDLKTVGTPVTTEFFPTDNQWRRETVDLTQFANLNQVMVVFRLSNNKENKVFVDNINITTRTLPAILKQQGYLVLPTITRNSFTVWHYLQPTTLKYVNVYSATGQLIWTRQYNGNGERYINVDLSSKAAGVYIVKIGYTDESKNVIQRVIKQ